MNGDIKYMEKDIPLNCEELIQRLRKAESEADYLREAIKNLEAQTVKLQAQLDIVYLIFGNK